ncbi:TadE/TadG family type IV pilus assembly protein [Parasphingorhabdus litoris]|nr:TadE/TadG family type IV pilus assembly protein [Parasphingorhabdus litoris]
MKRKFDNLSLVKDTSGLALVEFAFTAPLLLTFGLGGLETANLAVAHLQVSQVAMLAADNASRVRTTIDEADIREIFTGVHLTGNSIDFSPNARVILSNLEHNGLLGSDEGQWIRWQRCYGSNTKYSSSYGAEGDGRTDSSLAGGIGPTGKKIEATAATAVNFVEVVYDYKPLVSDRFFGEVVIRYQSAFVSRERADHALRNASSIPASELWTCNRYATVS